MENDNIKVFSTEEKIAEYLANFLINETNKKKLHERFSIAVSGGSTPKKIFGFIAKNFSNKINWKKINLFFCDERCVLPTDNESNFKMVKESLLDIVSFPKENIFRIKCENNPQKEVIRYAEVLKIRVKNKNNIPHFDVTLLGLGEDGHIASIFPNQINLFNSNRFCEIAVHPKTGQQRITITGKIINNSKIIIFIVTGKNKTNIISKILNQNNSYKTLPVSLVNSNNGKVIWLLDNTSSQMIKK